MIVIIFNTQAVEITADLSEDEGIKTLVEGTLNKFGTIHVLVSNLNLLCAILLLYTYER